MAAGIGRPIHPRTAGTNLPAVLLLVFASAAGCQPGASHPAAPPTGAPLRPLADASLPFFEHGAIPDLRIELGPSQMQKLREDARRYVRGTVIENGDTTFAEVGIKLKGAAGSFRELDDRPAFTIHMARFGAGTLFHDLEKWHLNNSVQDESYLCELVCSHLCRQAQVPTPRVTHARVWLNDRDLGLYVLKEGFDRRFLRRHFEHPDGNLYDGGFLQDIDAELEKDLGNGVDDRSDLRQLSEACRDPDPTSRGPRLEALLDIDRFLTFMAIELMTCHWDGYTCSKNNYRLYMDPASGQAHFLPHGMDQMFHDPNFPLFNRQEPIVAAAVWDNPAWRVRLREHVQRLRPLFEPDQLHPLIDEVAARLEPVLQSLGQDAAAQHRQRVAELKQRLVDRARMIDEQLAQPEPTPLAFDGRSPRELTDWYPAQETDNAHLEFVEADDGRRTWTIAAGAGDRCVASWRQRVLLAQGRYQLAANARCRDLVPLREEQGTGAGVRVSGGQRANQVTGDSDGEELTYDFEVLEPTREVELVVELRARRGQVWYDAPLVLRRLSDP